MTRVLSPLALVWAVLLSGSPSFQAAETTPSPALQNWPAWRGPLANGVAPEGDPPQSWSETENVLWKVQVPGRGSATPIVWDNLVFIQTAVPAGSPPDSATAAVATPAAPQAAPADAPAGGGRDGRRGPGGFGMRAEKPTTPHRFVLLGLDRQTGKTRWEKVIREEVPHEGHHQADGTFASSSPVTDSELVIAFFGSRGLHAFDHQGVYASPVAANGRIYLVGRNGAVAVVRQSDKFEVLATNRLEDRFDASPAITGKQLFLRGRESLYCLARL